MIMIAGTGQTVRIRLMLMSEMDNGVLRHILVEGLPYLVRFPNPLATGKASEAGNLAGCLLVS